MVNQDDFHMSTLRDRDLSEHPLEMEEALQLMSVSDDDLLELFFWANETRKRYCGDRADLCAITNARSGACGEDCAFCSQSGHNLGEAEVYGMRDPETILAEALQAEEKGAHRFCIVTSGGKLSERDFQEVLEALVLIAENTGMMRCASLGRVGQSQINSLKDAGLQRYHHNLEACRSHYPRICSTQNWEEKRATALLIKENGLGLCSGGILNLGETPRQRLELAFELRELEPESVPVNLLNPRPGTPLADTRPLPPQEVIKTLALYRLIMPATQLRLAGGRCENLGGHQSNAFLAGVNSLLIGDYLTTSGPRPASDQKMLERLGFLFDKNHE